ncbi:hypothetical protein ABL78_1472 [Leptomonas seymouri]|uniref:Uncharacterized protein n=1 Tax=Leptomonas seymouri TaxID=5684 RepID=A0A0N0P821_LEPSE|nr:hypothetical protein ABL78_1472 [Leptomonas seymouri]|eukprot:KPI89436.1 hypothetical protein ABL78_1472 [Leptomonas seymouri]
MLCAKTYRGLVSREVICVSAGALLSPLRRYTPIYAPDPATDNLAALRTEDECRALWAQHIPVPSFSRALELWLRFGNDPVVHTAGTATAAADHSNSPFAYVEDYMGTNMVTGTEEHVRESVELWSSFFETKYLRRMRQSRRTSRQYVGVLKASSENGASSGLFLDEADSPNTKWEGDTFFREVAYLSERHLKVKVTNYLQLEKVLWSGTADVEAFIQFFDAFQQQTVTRIPLPVPSIWMYDTVEAKRKWAERYLPVCAAAHAFFQEKLRPHAAEAAAHKKLLADVAAAYRQVHSILLERYARQQKAGLCPAAATWAAGAHRNATAEEDAWVANEVEKEQRRVEECVFDPEDLLDTTPEWAAEHARIQESLTKPIEGGNYGFSLLEFWRNTEWREAVETLHVFESESLTRVAAAARRRLYTEATLEEVFAGLEESIAKGLVDLRAAVLKPHFNSVWCRWNYVKFGAASLVQHTHTASRQLLFHYAASTQEVAATAELYYGTKPLSSQLDYASPYAFRRSLARLCARYGVDMARAAQQPLLLSAANLAHAEGVVGRVVKHVAQPFGQRRRARYAAARADNQRLLHAVKEVLVTAPPSELLSAGADLRAVLRDESVKRARAATEMVKVWPLGSHQVVSYDWTTPAVDKLRLLNLTDRSLTAEQAAQRAALRRMGRAEISLWRRRTPEERQRAKATAAREAAEVKALVDSTPSLREISTYAETLYTQLTRERCVSAGAAPSEVEEPEWVFVVMLNDSVPLSETQSMEVFLPYTDAAGEQLPNGEYRVVVRGQDLEMNPAEHPALVSEGVSAAFSVFDPLPQLYAQFTGATQKGGEEVALEGDMAGADLIPLCAFLRDAGLHVPLSAEFAIGQSLDKEGRFAVSELVSALRSTRYHRSQCENGITDAQRAIEADCRMHWMLYHPAATEEEWATARRRVLNRSMAEERDWWMADPTLDVVDVRTGSASAPSVDFPAYPAAERYGAELCAVLRARGTNHMDYAVLPNVPGVKQSSSSNHFSTRVQADCTVDGTGALTSLHFGAPISEADVTMEEALQAAMEAIQVAQMRHNTLSMVKLGAYQKQAQTAVFCGVHGLEFGGKYARTYAYALDKAKKEMAETAEAGYVATVRVAEEEKTRLSEQAQTSPTVDRFASQTHPEQRLTRFAPRVKKDGYNMEDPSPSQTSTWGQ